MSGNLGELVIELSANLARFQSDMGKAAFMADKAAKDIKGTFTTSMGQLEGMLGKVGTAAGVVTSVLAGGAIFGSIVSTTKEVTAEVVKLSKVFGITAEDASVLRVALDDAFLTADQAVAASDRLTRASIKNSEAFKKVGIDVRDSGGHLKDSLSVMLEVSDYLKTLKEGKERDTAAMSLYGKGWRELSGILRLNSEGLKEAKDRAEKLHLIIGPDGIAQTREYRLAMKDLDDVAESLKVTIGRQLIPVLTDLAVAFGETGTEAADDFAAGMKKTLRTIAEAKLNLQDLMHQGKIVGQGGPINALKAWFTKDGRDEITAELDAQEQMYRYSMERIAERYGNTVKARRGDKDKPAGHAPDMAEDKDKSANLWVSAHDKYLAYLKTFGEKQAAIAKVAAEEQQEINREAYEWGIIDLKTYLDTKHALTISEIEEEIKLKKGEVERYGKDVDKYKNDNTAKGANAYHEALNKQAEAEKGLIELEGKLKLARLTNADKSEKALHNQAKELSDLAAQVLELAGHYELAAKARADFEKQSPDYLKLSPEQRAQRDALSDSAARQGAKKDTDLGQQRDDFMADLDFSVGGNNRFGNPAINHQRKEIERQYQQRLKQAEEFYGQDAALHEKWTKAKEKAEEERTQRLYSLEKSMWEGRAAAIGDGMARVGDILMRGNKEQFEAGKALAIASTVVNTYMAASSAFAGITASTGGWGIALAVAEAAIAVATGMAQVAVIESTEYQPRARGGPVEAGASYLVGEQGPELLTMGQPGLITPNHALSGGGGVSITQVYQISTGVSDTVRAELMQHMPLIKAHTVNAVQQAIESGGSMAASVRRR